MRLFSTEQVSKYHPDKVCDQISDAILDACLAADPNSRVACETLFKGDTIVIAGEITTSAKINYAQIATNTARKLGYDCTMVYNIISTQSPEIARGVGNNGAAQGAGDQGMMYGYACNDTESKLPYGFDLANKIIKAIEDDIDRNGEKSPYKGDAKCQVTVDLDEAPDMRSVKKILVSVCHKHKYSVAWVRSYTERLLRSLGVDRFVETIINPAGEWILGGPVAKPSAACRVKLLPGPQQLQLVPQFAHAAPQARDGTARREDVVVERFRHARHPLRLQHVRAVEERILVEFDPLVEAHVPRLDEGAPVDTPPHAAL